MNKKQRLFVIEKSIAFCSWKGVLCKKNIENSWDTLQVFKEKTIVLVIRVYFCRSYKLFLTTFKIQNYLNIRNFYFNFRVFQNKFKILLWKFAAKRILKTQSKFQPFYFIRKIKAKRKFCLRFLNFISKQISRLNFKFF